MKLKYDIKIIYYNKVNDLIAQIRHIKNNKLNGEYKVWHIDGSLVIKCNYKDDNRDGEFIIYQKDGNIQEHLYYKDDKMI